MSNEHWKYLDWAGDELLVQNSDGLTLVGIQPGHLVEIPPRELLKMALAANGITPVDIVNAVHGDHDERTREPGDAVDAVCDMLWPDYGSRP